jgi:hypothetical protein
VKAGHPQMAAGYFKGGRNPLDDINAAIGPPAVKWF